MRLLELACATLATASELEAANREDGFLIPAATGGKKANPKIKLLETQRNAAYRILSDFGLSLKARRAFVAVETEC